MYTTAQSIRPVYFVFGGAFVPEQHGDREQSKIALADDERGFSDFAKVLSGLVYGAATIR
jgi:hypothetical protein